MNSLLERFSAERTKAGRGAGGGHDRRRLPFEKSPHPASIIGHSPADPGVRGGAAYRKPSSDPAAAAHRTPKRATISAGRGAKFFHLKATQIHCIVITASNGTISESFPRAVARRPLLLDAPRMHLNELLALFRRTSHV